MNNNFCSKSDAWRE